VCSIRENKSACSSISFDSLFASSSNSNKACALFPGGAVKYTQLCQDSIRTEITLQAGEQHVHLSHQEITKKKEKCVSFCVGSMIMLVTVVHLFLNSAACLLSNGKFSLLWMGRLYFHAVLISSVFAWINSCLPVLPCMEIIHPCLPCYVSTCIHEISHKCETQHGCLVPVGSCCQLP
jgi:hypothetical protein